uniref:YqbF C-terminal domain-containing protein n=1 Tax=viral metagenome TaxID=1070528 RepID=A0A6H1ZS51_9ZZZZ
MPWWGRRAIVSKQSKLTKAEISALNKAEQIALLKSLGASGKQIKEATYEKDRINLILKLRK